MYVLLKFLEKNDNFRIPSFLRVYIRFVCSVSSRITYFADEASMSCCYHYASVFIIQHQIEPTLTNKSAWEFCIQCYFYKRFSISYTG